MKPRKLAFVSFSALVFLFGIAVAAWAGGAGGVYGCCLAVNPGGGAIALQGTIAVVYNPVGYNSDVKLRLTRGGKLGFFQANLSGDPYGLENFEWACFILNPEEPQPAQADVIANRTTVTGLVNHILQFFFPDSGFNSDNRRLVITRSSISLSDGNSGEEIDETARRAAMADIVIYVVDRTKVTLEANSSCPE